jgi:hypothetical protein
MKGIIKSIQDFFKKAWKYFSGKKRNIALIYWSLLVPAITIIWPDGAPAEVHKTSSLIGLFLSYLGLGHAAIKKVNTGSSKPPVSETDEMPNKTE